MWRGRKAWNGPLLCCGLIVLCSCSPSWDVDWPRFGGDAANSQFSRLDRINRHNVGQLETAWVFHTGDLGESPRTQIQCNPLIIDGVLYGTTPRLKAFALEADTGKLIWMFDPFADGTRSGSGVNRGVSYWSDAAESRILYTAGDYLYALDAETGETIEDFGNGGSVDLHHGLDREVGDLFVNARTPGIIYKDLLIQGTTLSEGPETAPGHIRAYNVRSGERKWIFHTIPHPGEPGYETWPEDAWTRIGGANAWTGLALDEERGLVFAPTGSAAADFYGGNREGANLYANSLVALRASTGELVWHFQFVHHDLWDRDLPAAPNLLTVERNGTAVDAVAQITKSGHVFVFNRETGEPLFPIEEQPVPSSDLPGEKAYPTQPFPLRPPPFARQSMSEEDINSLSSVKDALLTRFRQIRSGGQFVPPSLQGTLIFPGFDGGGEWGGAAHDPDRGILYVNSNEMPWILTLVDVGTQQDRLAFSAGKYLYTLHCAACHGVDRQGDVVRTFPPLENLAKSWPEREMRTLLQDGKGAMPGFRFFDEEQIRALLAYLYDLEDRRAGVDAEKLAAARRPSDVPYAHTGYQRFVDPDGYPAIEPPWGTLNAIDLNQGEILWQVPLGEFSELTEKGIPPTGTENYGGPLVTAGGLLFIGATQDEKFRAFDVRDGSLLWETDLPAGGYATPATYSVNGRQYVVIAAGGGKMGTPSGDAYVAFSLPR